MEWLSLIAHNFLSFVVIISVIVFIHEFGHYWVAKRCGVKIDAFSIGFGPEIFGWKDKSGTRWKISAFPLGGYVKMFGDEGAASTPDNEKIRKLSAEEEKVAFHTQPLLAKSAIVSAGPIANFLLAILILTFFFAFYGRPETTPEVGDVQPESAAANIGLQTGDIITSLDGTNIARFEDIRTIASIHPEEEINITYLRDGKEINTSITPTLSESSDVFGNSIKIGLLGITSNQIIHKKLGWGESAVTAVHETWSISMRTLEALGQMITGRRSADELSGILRIADYSGKSVDQGLRTVFWFMAILSINLGLINLFPIPMLDGGHLMFYVIEAVSGRPLAERFQEAAFRVGFVLLILLMVFATFNDLKHFGVF